MPTQELAAGAEGQEQQTLPDVHLSLTYPGPWAPVVSEPVKTDSEEQGLYKLNFDKAFRWAAGTGCCQSSRQPCAEARTLAGPPVYTCEHPVRPLLADKMRVCQRSTPCSTLRPSWLSTTQQQGQSSLQHRLTSPPLRWGSSRSASQTCSCTQLPETLLAQAMQGHRARARQSPPRRRQAPRRAQPLNPQRLHSQS